MNTQSATDFDLWIRGRFKAHNTDLEEMYFRNADRADISNTGEDIKAALRDEGAAHIEALSAEPGWNGDEASHYNTLGNVGMYMAALRRHELTNPDREERSPFPVASALAQRLAAGLGVAPRFAAAHINLYNVAIDGEPKSFTKLPDEYTFIKHNCLGMLGYIRAADALRRIPPLGVSHPVTFSLLQTAKSALDAVCDSNDELNQKLDVHRFFYCIRPYFKTYRVGRQAYRGANAGDFAAINEVDLLLGLCRVADPMYSGMLLEKLPFMSRDDQNNLRASSWQTSLLDDFLREGMLAKSEAIRQNARAFLAVCDAHGRAAAQHHDLFLHRFIAKPSADLAEKHMSQLTASGPALAHLMHALEVLRDKRLAANRQGIDSRHDDIQRLRALALA